MSDSYGSLYNRFFRFSYGRSAFGSSRDVWRSASPISHVKEGVPSFLLLNASSDFGLETDARRLVERLRACGVDAEHFMVAKSTHASIASRFGRHQAHEHVLRFIHQVIGVPAGQGAAELDRPMLT